jgi:CRP/FNR family cyclic AMP-dependent transcriptional regulator
MSPHLKVSPTLLRNVPLFADLPDKELALLANVIQRSAFKKGIRIVNEGDPGIALYILISGRLKVTISNKTGKEVVLAILEQGDYFGEMALLDSGSRSASVITAESSELLQLGKTDFYTCLLSNPQLGTAIMSCLVQRLREANKKISNLALLDVYGRVASALHDLAESKEGERIIPKNITRQDIADMVGASREMVGRVLFELRARGLIEISGRTIKLVEVADSLG